MTNETLLRLPEVIRRTGLSRSSIYAAISRKEFPAAVALGERSVAWAESQIAQWVADRIAVGRRVA